MPSYTAPSGDAVTLSLRGPYTPPSGGSVTLQLELLVPTLRAVTKTTTAFVAKAIFNSDTAISGSTAAAFEQPYRSTIINSTSACSFVTNQRHVEISGASTPVFRYGFRALVSGATSVAAEGIAAIQSSLTVTTASSVAIAPVAYFRAGTTIRAKTTTAFAPGWNKQTRGVVRGASSFDAVWRTTNRSVFSAATTSSLAAIGRIPRAAAAALVTSTSVTPIGGGWISVPFSASGASEFVPLGARSWPMVAAVTGQTTPSFVSDYVQNYVDLTPKDVVFVLSKKAQVFVVSE